MCRPAKKRGKDLEGLIIFCQRHLEKSERGKRSKSMSPADIPWWGWIVLTPVLWKLQLVVSAYSDKNIPANKHPTFFWIVRIVLIGGMVLSFLVGIVRFVRWAWYF
jgi:hypothetical protein